MEGLLINAFTIRIAIRNDLAALSKIQLSNWKPGAFWVDGYHARLENAFQIEPEGVFLAESELEPLGWVWAMAYGPKGLREIGQIILLSVDRTHWAENI